MTDWITRNIGMFSGAEQTRNFREMSTVYPVRVIRRAPTPSPLEPGPGHDERCRRTSSSAGGLPG